MGENQVENRSRSETRPRASAAREIVYDRPLGFGSRLVYIVPGVAAVFILGAAVAAACGGTFVLPAWVVPAAAGILIILLLMPIRFRILVDEESRYVFAHVDLDIARVRKRRFMLDQLSLSTETMINVFLDEEVCSTSIICGQDKRPLCSSWERWFFGIHDAEMVRAYKLLESYRPR